MAIFCRCWAEFGPLPVDFVGFSTAGFSWGFLESLLSTISLPCKLSTKKVTTIGFAFVQKHWGYEDIGAVRNRRDAAWQDLLGARMFGCPTDACHNDQYCCDN